MSRESTILTIFDLTVVKKRQNLNFLLKKEKDGQSNIGYLVRNMNLSVNRSKIHGIVGESGSGKSLTMKCILGLIDFSPGIISGNIQVKDKDKIGEILPQQMNNGNNPQWLSWFFNILQKENILSKTEYFYMKSKEPAVEITHSPVLGSVQVYSVDKHKNRTHTDFVPPSKLKEKLIRLVQLPNDNQIIAVSYQYTSKFSSYRFKNLLDKIQERLQLRGKRVSMILQDPQTFLNPFWSIEKQLNNSLLKQRSSVSDRLYIERNFTMRIIGSVKDFPVYVNWDSKSFNLHLRQADIWMDGKSSSMLSLDGIVIEKGSLQSWGVETSIKKFSLFIHPKKEEKQITIKWNRQKLSSKAVKATLSIINQGNINNTNMLVDMLVDNSISLNSPTVNKEGILPVELDLIIKSKMNFEYEFEIWNGIESCKLLIGINHETYDGFNLSAKKQYFAPQDNQFYAGFRVNKELDNGLLSHTDIKLLIDVLYSEVTLTITPKYDKDYVGQINVKANSLKNRVIEFGLLNSATDGRDKNLGEKDISSFLREGDFAAGFVIEEGEDEILSPKDFRGLKTTVDLETEVSSLLSKVNLNDEEKEFRRQYPNEISGGQGQRVMISLAMAAKPELLIADEPTTGLDVSNQTEIIQLFLQYKNQGRTIILISHDLNFVSHLADYYTIIYAGTDVEHLSNDKLKKSNLLHPYTKRLVEIAKSEDKEGFTFIKKDVPDPYRSEFSGCPFEPRCEEKEKIPGLKGNHLCKCLFPPMVDVEDGKIINIGKIKEKKHYIRCWLFLKPQ